MDRLHLALALAAVVFAPWIPLALIGWPQLFSAAGHIDNEASGANVSRVAGLGYLGMPAGPAVIGGLTRLRPLNVAFLLPLGFCVIAAAGLVGAPAAVHGAPAAAAGASTDDTAAPTPASRQRAGARHTSVRDTTRQRFRRCSLWPTSRPDVKRPRNRFR